jgi:adenylate cyclase
VSYTATRTAFPQQFQELTAWSQIGNGWLDIRRGRAGGADRIGRARDTLFRIGMRSYQSLFAAMAATGLLRDGRHEEADALLTEGLTLVGETGECWCEAEIHRLRGVVRLAQAVHLRRATTKRQELVGDAEACFARALAIARAQGAKWWELRTAVTRARLLRDRDRAAEARELLQRAYDGFDQGVDRPDLRAAQELLQSLPSAPKVRTS